MSHLFLILRLNFEEWILDTQNEDLAEVTFPFECDYFYVSIGEKNLRMLSRFPGLNETEAGFKSQFLIGVSMVSLRMKGSSRRFGNEAEMIL